MYRQEKMCAVCHDNSKVSNVAFHSCWTKVFKPTIVLVPRKALVFPLGNANLELFTFYEAHLQLCTTYIVYHLSMWISRRKANGWDGGDLFILWKPSVCMGGKAMRCVPGALGSIAMLSGSFETVCRVRGGPWRDDHCGHYIEESRSEPSLLIELIKPSQRGS